MRGQALLLAGVLMATSLGAAAPAMADPYRAPGYGAPAYGYQDPACAQAKQNRMLLGGAIGAVAGAVLGKNVAAGNAHREGAVLGGVVGAASGAAIGRASVKCDGQQTAFGYGRDGYGLEGGPVRTSGGDYGYGAPPAPRQDCRWGVTTTRDPDGRELKESVYMCRGSDGIWRRQ